MLAYKILSIRINPAIDLAQSARSIEEAIERQVKVLIKHLAIFFLFPSKKFLPISFSCRKLLPTN